MDRVVTAASLDELASADFNNVQDRALGIAQASGSWLGLPPAVSATGADNNALVGPTPPLALGLETVLAASAGATVATGGSSGQHYLYAYDNAGAIGYEATTTAPDLTTGGLYFKTGTTTHVLVTTFYKTSTSIVRGFRRTRNGEYRLFTPLEVLNTSTEVASLTALDLSGAGELPVNARVAFLAAVLDTDNDFVNGVLYISPTNSGADERLVLTVNPDDAGAVANVAGGTFDVVCNASRICYWRNGGGATGEVTIIYLIGWIED